MLSLIWTYKLYSCICSTLCHFSEIMMATEVLKVYVPHELFVQSESFLYGHVNNNSHSVYITAASCDSSLTHHDSVQMIKLGKWTYSKLATAPSDCLWVSIYRNTDIDIVCDLYDKGRLLQCICIIYNPLELLKTCVHRQRAETSINTYTNIVCLINALKESENLFSQCQTGENVVPFCWKQHNSTVFSKVFNILLAMLYYIYLPFKCLGSDFEG